MKSGSAASQIRSILDAGPQAFFARVTWWRIVFLSMTLLTAACATVARGTSEQVVFDSEPAGAEMRSVEKHECGGPCPPSDPGSTSGKPYITQTPIVAGPACVTPCTLTIARNKELIVTFSKEGFEPKTMVLESRITGGAAATAGNVIVGGAIGLMVDAGTAAGNDHFPNPMKAVLKPLPAAQRRR